MKARIMMLITAVVLVALPAMAQQEWQSTSAMQGSGSAYSAQVTAVGATGVTDMASTTTSTPNNGPRRAKKDGEGDFGPGGNDGGYQDPNFPIGDAWPLALFAALFAIVITIKKHKKTMMKKNFKTILFIAALVMSNSAWADVTMPKGTYYFDFSGFDDKVFEINVFNNINDTAYISFSSLDACNSSVSQRASDHHIYENLTVGYTYLKLEISTPFSKGGGFIQIRHGSSNGSTSLAGWFDYSAPTAIGGEEVYVCKVTASGFTWGSTSSDIPECSGVAPSDPVLSFSAGANGSITLATAGLDTISSGAAVAAGTSVNLVATPNTGYAFYCWSNASGDPVSTNANYVFSMPSSSYSLTASFYADNTDPAINGCAGCFRVAP